MKMAPSGRWRWVLLALGAMALGVLAVAALGLIFGRQWLVKPGWSGPPEVQFRQPFSGQELGLNDEFPIFIRLSPSEAMGRLELWIDGELSDALDLGEPPGTFPSEVAFTWRPGEAGPHVLVARAADLAGRIGISRPVIVKVTDDKEEPWVVSETIDAGETVESIAGALGMTPDEILAANPEVGASPAVGIELSIPVPRDRLPAGYVGDDAPDPGSAPPAVSPEPALALGGEGEGQATEVSVASPRGLPKGLAWNLGNPSLPTAPQQIALTASGGCTVEVRFSDDSLSEAGFRVYRWGPASSDFYPVAELGPNRASETLVFQDQVPFPGLHLYYVAAVNAWGEAPGAMAPVEVSGEGCIPEQPAQGDRTFPLQLEVLELVTTPAGSLDSAYCYLSLAFIGASHLRLPAAEDTFFTPRGEGWNIADHAAGSGRIAFRQPLDQSIPFGMECWGWAGDDLVNLGAFEVNLPPETWLPNLPQVFTGEGTAPEGNGFRASYRISLFLPEGLEFVPVDYCPAPCDSEFPAPYDLNIADTTDDCIEGHVNLAGGDLGDGAVAAEWACLELDPDQMLTWEWDETAGVPRSQTQGFQVWTYPS
ncbi:MAG: hypothetical protein MUO23_00500, partial [Anaerolineales bacterium]|nr:hypothetical protein [Anaerolineales bacterium]